MCTLTQDKPKRLLSNRIIVYKSGVSGLLEFNALFHFNICNLAVQLRDCCFVSSLHHEGGNLSSKPLSMIRIVKSSIFGRTNIDWKIRKINMLVASTIWRMGGGGGSLNLTIFNDLS